MENTGKLKEEINITLYLATNFQSQLTFWYILQSFFYPYVNTYNQNNTIFNNTNTDLSISTSTDLSPLGILTHIFHNNCYRCYYPCYV